MQDELILNRPIFSQIFFRPRQKQCEVYRREGSNGLLDGTVHEQIDPALPTLIHFHGNGEAVADYVQAGFVARLHAEVGKMNVLMVEYPGYAGLTGRPKLVDMLGDAEEMVHELQLDPSRCVAYGRSIGSLYALELAVRFPNLGGLFIDSGIADIRVPFLNQFYPPERQSAHDANMQQLDAEIDHYFHHKNKIAGFQGHLIICHTCHDSLISSMDAKLLYVWATTKDKELRLYPEGDHNSIFAYNQEDMLFALKRMMAGIVPQTFPLPSGSVAELVVPIDREKTDVYSPYITGMETPMIVGRVPWERAPDSASKAAETSSGGVIRRWLHRLGME